MEYAPLENVKPVGVTDKTWKDLERDDNEGYLYNDTVGSFQWSHIDVSIKDKASDTDKFLLKDIGGGARGGDVIAILGPSGSGKTTLLNILASRSIATKATIRSNVFVNRVQISQRGMQKIARYVEQNDSLIGSLTARETLDFAAKLGMPGDVNKSVRSHRVRQLLKSFGLSEQAETIIGTPVRKGLSGGQKRRVSIASQLITGPKILFLDEPTSGLDSAASHEVMAYLKAVAKQNKIIVIASIHQPSASTYNLFDKIFLLSKGSLCYAGARTDVPHYFQSIGYPIPEHVNIPEFLLDLTNTDFSTFQGSASQRLTDITEAWQTHARHYVEHIQTAFHYGPISDKFEYRSISRRLQLPIILLHRNFLKSYRDVFAYGLRLAMYLGLAFMMGLVWLRLQTSQDYIQPFINAIFFGSAFMSFMAVAYVPSYLEDRAMFIKERANGLYGAGSFLIANFLIGLPYLFIIAFLFSLISYWLCNFRPDGSAFFTWIMWVFLDLIAAESLVVFLSSLMPIFVVALAAVAFANGLWMSVGGFLVSPVVLRAFWKDFVRYIDYQSYVFQGMMVNEFSKRTYDCARLADDSCQCMYPPLASNECLMSGQAVLDSYGYQPGWERLWVGILICIVLGYRLLAFLVLYFKKN